MYEHFRGTLESKHPARAVVDVGGVGYVLAIPLSTYERLPVAGKPVRLFVDLSVREDSMRLFGFATEEERQFFRELQGVSGVGPAVALGIVSSIPLITFQTAVLAGDAKQLQRVKGVGKRLSERLVLELRDSMRDLSPSQGSAAPEDVAVRDALLALEALGFPRPAAATAIKKVHGDSPPDADSGDLVRAALRVL